MTRSSDPTRDRSNRRAGRVRMLLAGLVALGMAITGLALAAPAAAEEETPAFDSTLEIAVTDCGTYGGQGVLHYVVHDMYPSYRDFITVTDAADTIVHEATYLDDTEFEADVPLSPGEYTIIYTVERETGGANIDEQTFTIGACPDLDVSVTTTCSTGVDGSATFEFTGLVEGEEYRYEVVGDGTGTSLSGSFIAGGPSEAVVVGELPPGNFYVYVQWQPEEPTLAAPPPPMFDWRGFAVEPCQPAITVEVTECVATGGTGSALVTLSNLVAGVEYDVRVTDAGDPDGAPYGGAHTVTADEHGTAQLSFSKLPPGADFTVWVAGLWSTTPWEEPPFIGGGNFTPLEEFDLVAQADFTLKPCPVAASTSGLAATGTDGVGALVLGALVLLGLGGAALFVARRRRTGARDVS
ncbi:hypothetical protein [Agromyces bauzanensis]